MRSKLKLDLHFQVSECIKLLQTSSTLPIQRARMRIRITIPVEDGQKLKDKILENVEKVEEDKMGEQQWETVSLMNTLFCCSILIYE